MYHKLCILIDPDKIEAYSVIKACLKNKELINREEVEIWVGTSKTNFQTINYFARLLKKAGISQKILFPGRLDHVLCYGNVDKVFRPKLLNCTKWYMHLYVKLGKLFTTFFDLILREQKAEDYGYLTTGPNSTVGKKLGSIHLDEREIIDVVRKYSKGLTKEKGLYFEAGSGAKEPVSPKVIKEARKILPRNMEIIVGGGINSVEKVKEFFNSGANKVVVGTHFEKCPEDVRKFIESLYEISNSPNQRSLKLRLSAPSGI